MVSYLDNFAFDRFYIFYCELHNLDPLRVLLNHGKEIFHKLKVDDIKNCLKLLDSDNSLFEEESISNSVYLIDITTISITASNLSLINTVNKQQIYIYSSSQENLLTTETKKLLQKNSIDYIKLDKINPETIFKIGVEYRNQKQILLSTDYIRIKSKNLESYYEIIDLLDLANLLDNPLNVDNLFLKEDTTPLFFLNLNPAELNKNIQSWHKHVSIEELQLALSLIFSKIEKSNWSKKNIVLQLVTETDYNIKSSTKITQSNLWKYLLYKIKSC
jgi:hypothetical protein